MMKCAFVVAVFFVSFSSWGQWPPGYIDTLDFENSNMRLEIDSIYSGSQWQIGRPSKSIFDSAYSSFNSIVTDTLQPYQKNTNTSFTVGFYIDGDSPSVEFTHRFDTDSLSDAGIVEISIDTGQSWVLISDTLGFNSTFFYSAYGVEAINFYPALDSSSADQVGFTGQSSGWVKSTLYFPCLAIKQPYPIYLRFTFVSDSIGDAKDGWIIDDIIVQNEVRWGCSSLNENNGLVTLNVYPNPSFGAAKVDLPHSYHLSEGEYRIFALNGRELNRKVGIQGKRFELELNNLSPGMYFFRVYDGGVALGQGKLVIN